MVNPVRFVRLQGVLRRVLRNTANLGGKGEVVVAFLGERRQLECIKSIRQSVVAFSVRFQFSNVNLQRLKVMLFEISHSVCLIIKSTLPPYASEHCFAGMNRYKLNK